MSAQFSTPVVDSVRLSELLRILFDVLEREPLSLTRMNRIRQTDGSAANVADRSYFVEVPSSQNTDLERGPGTAWVDDEINVYTVVRVNPKDQTESELRGMDLEEDVRIALTSRHGAGLQPFDVVYRGTPARGPSTNSAEWHITQQSYRIRRYARLGG